MKNLSALRMTLPTLVGASVANRPIQVSRSFSAGYPARFDALNPPYPGKYYSNQQVNSSIKIL